MRRAAFTTVILAVVGSLLWGFWLEPASLRVEEVNLPLAWPYPRPLRVAVVSDLHVGSPFQSVGHLHEVVDRINASKPDMVCMLGDFVTRGVIGGHYVPPEPIAAALSHNWRAHREVDSALDAVGIRVLKDTAVRVATPSGSVWLVGVGDLASAPHDVPRSLLPVTDDTTPVILLTHNPDLFRQVPGRVLLTLAGHTHGGQVRLPLIGSPIVPSRYGQRYVRGHIRERGRDLFVSTGIGTSVIPVRFGVPPTIFVLEIARPEQ